MIVPKSFYHSEDVVEISKKLLGKVIRSMSNGVLTTGRIVETEAYKAPEDKASHAYQYRRSPKNEHMYAIGGTAYVYICYGIHDMFNVSTGPKDCPHAVLIRAIEPLEGVKHMLERRKMKVVKRNLTAGPGVLCSAMGIDKTMSGSPLYDSKNNITIIDDGYIIEEENIISSPRVGLTTAEEWTDIPWRFRIRESKWTSPAK